MKIYFAADHAGVELKQALVTFVRDELLYEVEDLGAHTYDANDDYPDYIALAVSKVSASPADAKAIILGGSGQGEAIVANKFPGVRAAVFYGHRSDIVPLSREHNDANVLSLGSRFLNEKEAKDAVKLWLETPFDREERHSRRLEKIKRIEGQNFKDT
jgi:ribose 5-phosphate isomerase B